ncbi:S8 family serine peptidase [Sorangium sp. So ce118]
MADSDSESGPSPHQKLDPRLSALARLPREALEQIALQDRKARSNVREIGPRLRGMEAIDLSGRLGREEENAPGAAAPRAPAPLLHGLRMAESEIVADVLVRFRGDAGRLADLGVKVRSVAGDVATAEVPLRVLPRLEQDPDTIFIELSRPTFPLLDRSVQAIHADALHRASPQIRGAGTVIGIIDVDGIDFHHPDFCVPAAGAPRTRIAWLWDQQIAGPRAAGAIPARWGYGVEYSAADIDRDLAGAAPYAVVDHRPDLDGAVLGHGTHMAGIAAGNGRASEGKYTGVAPEAEIVFVNTTSSGTRGLGDMSRLCDAIAYVFERAGNRPCVASISLGDNLGPHDGTSLVERFIDAAVARPGRAVVVAAGNSNDRGQHAELCVTPAGAASLELMMPPSARFGEAIEIWYPGDDRLELTVVGPGGERAASVPPGTSLAVLDVGMATVAVSSIVRDGRNGDNVIGLLLQPSGPLGRMASGRWRFELRRVQGAAEAAGGVCHAWIDGNTDARWSHPAKGRCTLTTPATSRGAITVGNCMPSLGGGVSDTSSRGPTRDGRRKPDVVAPGRAITAPLASAAPLARAQAYESGFGTSQAAAHVAGVAALLFQSRGAGLDALALKVLLTSTAERAGAMDAWDPAAGWGCVHAAAASKALIAAAREDEGQGRGGDDSALPSARPPLGSDRCLVAVNHGGRP